MTLDQVVDETRKESAARQRREALAEVRTRAAGMAPARGLARALGGRAFSVIAEIKRRSPSAGEIPNFDFDATAVIYRDHPIVSAISVLTQNSRFGGAPDDLEMVRRETGKPVLRKDFIFSEYEVYYSRAIGADAILLMANVVTDKGQFRALHELAVSLGMDVLCEIHTEEEIERLPETVRICGINSRRFKGVDQKVSAPSAGGGHQDLTTDIATFALFDKLAARVPKGCLRVAESGLSSGNIQAVLKKYRFQAALIGTSVLKSSSGLPAELTAIGDQAAMATATLP